MKKTVKKVLTFTMVAATAMSMVACGGPQQGQEGSIHEPVYMVASLAGYKTEWLNAMAKKYKEETGSVVEIEWDASLMENLGNVFETEANMPDLYYANIGSPSAVFTWYVQGKLETLNDVFAEQNGAGKTIEASLKAGRSQSYILNGKRYAAPLTDGNNILVYNPDYLTAVGWDHFPITVDEFVEFAQDIKDAKIPTPDGKDTVQPLVWTGMYYSAKTLVDTFEAQYNGATKMSEFYNQNGAEPDEDLYNMKGLEVACQNLAKMMAPKTVGIESFSDNSVDGSLGMSHTEAQAAFLNGYAAVCTTGTWFENEMGENCNGKKYKIAPIPFAADENGSYGAVVKKDPNGPDNPSNYKHVRAGNLNQDALLIPTKSQNKAGARAFIKFLLQEENLKEMQRICGSPFAYEYDTSDLNLTGWNAEVAEYYNTTEYITLGSSQPYALFGVIGGYKIDRLNKICTVPNYNYQKEIIDWRWTNVSKNWADKASQLEGIEDF